MVRNTFFLSFFLIVTFNLSAQHGFWGVASAGGGQNLGVIFRYDTASKKIIDEFDFKRPAGSNGISYANSGLMYSSNGMFYALTTAGGSNNLGVLLEYNPYTDTIDVKVNFTGDNGSGPNGVLTEAANGKFYGLTESGGPNFGQNKGCLFEYDPETEKLTVKYSFKGGADGAYPDKNLLLASNGKLYGVTTQGGTNDEGILFEYDPRYNELEIIASFSKAVSGATPFGTLIQNPNGRIYGTTASGGINDNGVIFEYNPGSTSIVKKADFAGTNGSNPMGLTLDKNGLMYGMCSQGGEDNEGVIFSYNPNSNLLVNEFSFKKLNTGFSPRGTLTLGSDGMFYGLTYNGGIDKSNIGALFTFDPKTKKYEVKDSFNRTNGGNPLYTKLLEVTLPYLTKMDTIVCKNSNFITPSGNSYLVSSNPITIKDTLKAKDGLDSVLIFNLKPTKTSPFIYSNPKNITICEGTPISLSVSAIGTNPFSYIWKKNDEIIFEGGSSLSIPNSSIQDEGSYIAIITGVCGESSSSPAIVTVNPKPSVTTSKYKIELCLNKPSYLFVDAADIKSYTWKKDGEVIPNSDNDTLYITSTTFSDEGNYSIEAMNDCGTTISEIISVTIKECTATGLHSNQKKSYRLYPNPSSGEININLSENPQMIRIINSMGKEIYKASEWKSSYQIQDLDKGFYLIEIEVDGQIWIEKVLVY